MKRLLWTIPALVIGSVSVLAGASSENRLDDKALKGPGDGGAHSTDPNIDRSGSTGPAGPSNSQKPSYNYNNPSSGSSGSSSSTDSGSDGSSGNSGSMGSSSGKSQVAPNTTKPNSTR